MSLPNLAKNAADRDAQTILFGLLADGSGASRFAGADGTPFGAVRPSADSSRFSPCRDWYGRWAVQPLRGTLMPDARRRNGSVCPDDIVVLEPRRRARWS